MIKKSYTHETQFYVIFSKFINVLPYSIYWRIFLAVTIAKYLLWLKEDASVIFSPFGVFLSRFGFLRLTKNLKNCPLLPFPSKPLNKHPSNVLHTHFTSIYFLSIKFFHSGLTTGKLFKNLIPCFTAHLKLLNFNEKSETVKATPQRVPSLPISLFSLNRQSNDGRLRRKIIFFYQSDFSLFLT